MEKETFGTVFSSVKEHSQNWVDAKMKVYQLIAIKLLSKLAGNLTWFIISLFLFFLLSVFIGLTIGFWLSNYYGSYTVGFGIVALLILLKIVLLAVLRKKIFINPMIRKIIRQANSEWKEEEPESPGK